MAPGSTGSIDQHERPSADEFVSLGEGDGVLELSSFPDAFGHQIGWNLAGEVHGVGAVLWGVGEEPGPVELRVF